jgi:hypothetical protein
VQPRPDPADDLPAASKLYVVPVGADDVVLTSLESRQLVRIHGGSERTAIVSLAAVEPAADSGAAAILAASALWLAEHAVNNELGSPRQILSVSWLAERRRQALAQRTEAGRMMLAALLLAREREREDPRAGHDLRQAARAFGAMASFLGDESSIGFIDAARHERLRENLRAVATEARGVEEHGASPARLLEAIQRLGSDYFWAA